MQIRPAASPPAQNWARPVFAHLPAMLLSMSLAIAALLAQAPASALAGQIHESDLSISSKVGKISTTAEGDNVKAASTVHSVDIKGGSHTGEVVVSGQAGQVTTKAGGQNTSANSAIGGVNVGAKQ